MSGVWQQTIRTSVVCEGVGLHSGRPVSLRLRPAQANTGIRFVKHTNHGEFWLDAHVTEVSETRWATSIGHGDSTVHTVEHLLAALGGLGIDNLVVELSGSEIPIMDGSAKEFVSAIVAAGVVEQAAARSVLSITRSFEVRDGDGWIAAEPSSRFEIINTVDYPHPAIGRQAFHYRDEGPAAFAASLAGARTFGFLHDVERLKAAGFIQGGSLENAVVVGPEGILNPDGLRWPDEFVRHKTLDLLGDFVLLGRTVRGRVIAHKAGHSLHAKFMSYLTAHPEYWGVPSDLLEPAGAA